MKVRRNASIFRKIADDAYPQWKGNSRESRLDVIFANILREAAHKKYTMDAQVTTSDFKEIQKELEEYGFSCELTTDTWGQMCNIKISWK